MNKYEKAIRYFEGNSKVFEEHCKRGGDFASEALEHTKTAIEAMKKQVPRALKKYNHIYEEGICPSCGADYDMSDYCGVCGQKTSGMLSYCTVVHCADCYEHTFDGPVCKLYADKVDEIRRIHEEGE